MQYKVVEVQAEDNQPIRGFSNDQLISQVLNDHENEPFNLHSVVPVVRKGETRQFLVILAK